MLATKAPPTTGPINVHATGRTNWPSEFACTSRSSGTIVGTIELNAGAKIACPAPYTTTSVIRIGSVRASTIERKPIVPIAMPRMTSPAIMRCRRSSRSESTPLASSSTTCGRLHAIPTAASADGELDRSYVCHAMAMM
jgi:hypothetical protein